MYDTILVGGGPAGLSAAIYALRAGLKVLLLEQVSVGGQAALASSIENYPGLAPTDGFTLSMQMYETAKSLGLETKLERVVAIDPARKWVTAASGENYEGRTLILCMGARERELGLPNERALVGKGVSYCATCDGNFFRGRRVAVVGGGDTAIKDALYLQNICAEVSLIHRRDAFRAPDLEVRKLDADKVRLYLRHRVTELLERDGRLSGVRLEDGSEISADGLFVAVGRIPNTGMLPESMLDNGYIVTDEEMKTSFPGVFAAGDIRKKSLRQVVTAAADGAVAANSAIEYLK